MYFVQTPNDMWVPCGPKQHGAVQISMQELAAQGLASKVLQKVQRRTAVVAFSLLSVNLLSFEAFGCPQYSRGEFILRMTIAL